MLNKYRLLYLLYSGTVSGASCLSHILIGSVWSPAAALGADRRCVLTFQWTSGAGAQRV